MNNQNSKKIFTGIILTILGIGVFFFAPTLAKANGLIEINFEQDPLFQEELNFLPGEEVIRWVEVTNKSSETQPIGIKVINYSSCSTNCLSDQLQLVISDESTTELYTGFLTDFFEAGEIELSDLGPEEGPIKYYFSVTFLPESGNDYQNSTTNFDFKIGALGTESIGGEIPPGGGGGYFVPGLEIYNEDASGLEEEEVTITWLTTKPATSRVIYSSEFESHTLQLDNPPNYGYANSTDENVAKTLEHSVTISGLMPGVAYYYRCISRGSLAISTEHSFTTLGTAEEEGGEEEIPPTEEEIGEEIKEELDEQIVYEGETTPEGEIPEILSGEGVIPEEEETGKEEKQIVISPDSTVPVNPFLGFLASISDVVASLLGPCLNWWFILILVLYSLLKAFRAWKKGKNEVKVWLIWTLILIILTICFYLKICVCLDVWIFLILGLITYFIRWITLRGEEKKEIIN